MFDRSKEALLSAEELRRRVSYDPDTGLMIWIKCRKKSLIGTEVGSNYERYRIVGFREGKFHVHRLAWLYVHGEWPDGFIDHSNCNGFDNRIANLRIATVQQNLANRSSRGPLPKGVAKNYRGQRWRAQIVIDGKHFVLGSFDTPEAAHAAYAKRATEVYGEFVRLK